MKATKSGELEHRQLTLWDYPQKNTANRKAMQECACHPGWLKRIPPAQASKKEYLAAHV